MEHYLNTIREKIKNNPELQTISTIKELLHSFEDTTNKLIAGHKKKLPHQTIILENQDGNLINIDKNIAPLISEIWKTNIFTTNSCENNVPKDFIWIEFEAEFDLKEFLFVVFTGMSYYNPTFQRASLTDRHNLLNWQFKMNIDIGEDDESMIDNEITYSVRFPKCDYVPVLERFYHFNILFDKTEKKYNKIIKKYNKLYAK